MVRWNGHAGRRPAVPGTYEVWLRATDLAGNRSPRTLVAAAHVERDTRPPAVRVLRIGRARGNVRLRWRLSDNASVHVSIKISAGGRSVTLRRVPLAGRRTLALPAAGTAFTASITITDQSGNRVALQRRAA